jgi:hypothetical protein
LVNYNKNKEILTAPIKTDNGSVDGHWYKVLFHFCNIIYYIYDEWKSDHYS